VSNIKVTIFISIDSNSEITTNLQEEVVVNKKKFAQSQPLGLAFPVFWTHLTALMFKHIQGVTITLFAVWTHFFLPFYLWSLKSLFPGRTLLKTRSQFNFIISIGVCKEINQDNQMQLKNHENDGAQ